MPKSLSFSQVTTRSIQRLTLITVPTDFLSCFSRSSVRPWPYFHSPRMEKARGVRCFNSWDLVRGSQARPGFRHLGRERNGLC